MFESINSVEAFQLRPDSGGSAIAFARMGYQLSEAFADLIDNSIDAGASRVEITFFRSDTAVSAVTIADNGHGMDGEGLKHAMQFAASKRRKPNELGTYGVGMKSASLSQCRELTVISKQTAAISACRWTVEDIQADWSCNVLDPVAAGSLFPEAYSTGKCPPDHGTVVIWEQLDRFGTGAKKSDLDEFLLQTTLKLETHLGLIFHRFLLNHSLQIVIRTRREQHASGLSHTVKALDPFGYPSTGKSGYPKLFKAVLPDVGEIDLHAHIWPADSVLPEFLLGSKRATAHQGFYFYRNDRLIQAGGWNEVSHDMTDAELSLARVSIDLPPGGKNTNIQKSQIQVTSALSLALERAQSGKDMLPTYFEHARRVYLADRKKAKANPNAPLIPGEGLPIQLRRNVQKLVAKKHTPREIDFVWKSMPRRKVFDISRAGDKIYVNKKYRQKMLGDARASGTDVPLVKSLLFLLLEKEFDRSRSSAQRDEWLEKCNAVLLEAVRTL